MECLGERPNDVFEDVYELLPLDSVKLFAQALVVQWQTGGSLAMAASFRHDGRLLAVASDTDE